MRSKKKNTTLVLISVTALFVMLTLATACWQTADPAMSPNEEAQTSAHQGGASSTEKQAAPDQSGEPEVQTTSELEEYLAEHADVSIFDVMDEDTARLFSELPSDWQNERIEGWEQFKVDVSPDHWAEVLAWLVDNQHDLYTFTNRDETPSSEPPDGAQNEMNRLPESVRMLTSVYHDTFRLLPDGPWARKFLALRFEEIESIDWERLKASYAGPYPTPTPELDLGEEFQLSRALRDAGANDEEWLIGKVRSIDADAARQFEATQDVTERLETLRRLVEVEGKEQGVLEIEMEWQMRLAEWREVEIARFLERQRNSVALSEARRQWTPDEQRVGHAEITVCNAVMSYVVGENPGVYRPDGRCDIAKVIVMSKEALDARDGQDLYSEDDFREMAEFALQNPGQWLHVSPSGAAQASVDPVDEAETPGDAPDMADYMDAETAELFEQMNDEWQEMARDGWVDITTKFAPDTPGDWSDAAQSMISQMHPQAKIQGGIRGVPVADVQDLVDPDKGASQDGTTPFVLSLLSPEYTEAYELVPGGSLMREYVDIRLGRFSERGWESIKAQPDERYPAQAPKLDARDEFEVRRMLTNAGDAEWLVQRLRSLDAGAAREYEATNDSTERLAILRNLVEVDGKEQGVVEIRAEYGARSNGWDEAKIADYLERTRIWAAEREARSRMTPRQRHINHAESTLCGDLMSHIVGQEGRAANSSPGQCDIAKVITLTKETLEAGQMASSDEQLREAVEFARQTPGR